MLVRANKRLGAGSIDVFCPQYKLKYELIQIFWQWASCKPVTLFSGLFSKEPFLTERLETISWPGTGPRFYLTLYTWSNEECSGVGGGGQTLYSFSCPLLTTKEIWVWIMPAMLYIYVFASLTGFWFWVSRIHETENSRLLSPVSEKCTVRDPINLQIGD